MTSQLNYAPVYHSNSEWPIHIWVGRISDGETRCYVEQRTCENVDEYASAGFFICGECGFGENGLELVTTYCPNCGAKVVSA